MWLITHFFQFNHFRFKTLVYKSLNSISSMALQILYSWAFFYLVAVHRFSNSKYPTMVKSQYRLNHRKCLDYGKDWVYKRKFFLWKGNFRLLRIRLVKVFAFFSRSKSLVGGFKVPVQLFYKSYFHKRHNKTPFGTC
jgi:hypothetical protein